MAGCPPSVLGGYRRQAERAALGCGDRAQGGGQRGAGRGQTQALPGERPATARRGRGQGPQPRRGGKRAEWGEGVGWQRGSVTPTPTYRPMEEIQARSIKNCPLVATMYNKRTLKIMQENARNKSVKMIVLNYFFFNQRSKIGRISQRCVETILFISLYR